jgi:UDPglucose 6-dehydrogenase
MYFESPYEAADHADAVILATEWAEFHDLDLDLLRSQMTTPIFVDGRHMLDRADLEQAGFYVVNGAADVMQLRNERVAVVVPA